MKLLLLATIDLINCGTWHMDGGGVT